MQEKKTIEGNAREAPSKFSKEQILNSVKYRNRRDLLNAILKEDGRYTIEQVDKEMEKFMKRKVE